MVKNNFIIDSFNIFVYTQSLIVWNFLLKFLQLYWTNALEFDYVKYQSSGSAYGSVVNSIVEMQYSYLFNIVVEDIYLG